MAEQGGVPKSGGGRNCSELLLFNLIMNKKPTELEEQLTVCIDAINSCDTLLQSRRSASKYYIEELLRDRKLLLEKKEEIIAEMRKIKSSPSMLGLADYIDQKLVES